MRLGVSPGQFDQPNKNIRIPVLEHPVQESLVPPGSPSACFPKAPPPLTADPAPTRPRPSALLSGPATVAVALLLVGAVGRVPFKLFRLVGQHHLHGLQRPGDGTFLQRASFLRRVGGGVWVFGEEEARSRGRCRGRGRATESPHWHPGKASRGPVPRRPDAEV